MNLIHMYHLQCQVLWFRSNHLSRTRLKSKVNLKNQQTCEYYICIFFVTCRPQDSVARWKHGTIRTSRSAFPVARKRGLWQPPGWHSRPEEHSGPQNSSWCSDSPKQHRATTVYIGSVCKWVPCECVSAEIIRNFTFSTTIVYKQKNVHIMHKCVDQENLDPVSTRVHKAEQYFNQAGADCSINSCPELLRRGGSSSFVFIYLHFF